MAKAFIVPLEDSLSNDPSRDFSQTVETGEVNLLKVKNALLDRQKKGGQLLSKLLRKNCNAGPKHSDLFEKIIQEICEITLEDSFVDHAVTPHSRTLEINGLQQKIKDLSFPNHPKNTDKSCIWHILKSKYDLQSFVVECKNYTMKISSAEIYQLYEYIDPKEHGRFGVLISRNGEKDLDSSARSSIVRISKDRYKIIVLGDNEVKEWINSYISDGSPEKFFNQFIDRKRGWPI